MEFGYNSENDEELTTRNIDDESNTVKIKIFGVGGGGCNAIKRLALAQVSGVELIAANTDTAALRDVGTVGSVVKRITLGIKCTHGLGVGGRPEMGEQAAIEASEEIRANLDGTNLLFITAGMGGGTGTGGAPVIASIAKEMGILTIAVVTKPRLCEGPVRMKAAEDGIAKLKDECDVVVVVPNEKALSVAPKNTPMLKVLQIADDVLHNCIVGITDIVVKHTLINVDFADLETVVRNKGTAHIGVGRAKGENRVIEALRSAAMSPLLDSNISGAKQVIVSVTGDVNMAASMVQEGLDLLAKVVAPDANIIQGLGFDSDLKNEAIVTIVATGFDEKKPNARETGNGRVKPTISADNFFDEPQSQEQPSQDTVELQNTEDTAAPQPDYEQPIETAPRETNNLSKYLRQLREKRTGNNN